MSRYIQLIILILCFGFTTFSQENAADEKLKALAQKLAKKYVITDGHVDLPYRLRVQNFKLTREYLNIPIETDKGDFDYVRAKKGGLDAPFMSIYIPSSYQKDGGAKEIADTLIAMVKSITEIHPDKFQVANSPKAVKQNFRKGIISLPMGMENGAPIEDQISHVQYFKNKGISYITLTHSKDNLICDSSYDTTGTWGGLSEFGRQVVKEMNRTGIMVDVSHISDNTFWQVMDLTEVPCIASHSSCRKFTPDLERNMSDKMIKKMGEHGGVIQINFGTFFLDSEIQARKEALRADLKKTLEEQGLKQEDEAAKPIVESWKKAHFNELYADVERVADHIDHVVKLAGVEHVGFGSDYDGVGDSLPIGLKDVSTYPNLIYVLLKRGYSKKDISKICYKNVFRVWNKVLKAAE